MSVSSRITLVALAALALFLVAAKLRYEGKATRLPAENCDPSLWNHVYEKDRLRMIEACTAVEGRVVSLHRSVDGDFHIGMDPERKSILNLVNAVHAHSELVVEIVCEHEAANSAAQAACADYHPQLTIPKVGDRIRVTGAYVTDRDNGWNEIHPVTKIEVLH